MLQNETWKNNAKNNHALCDDPALKPSTQLGPTGPGAHREFSVTFMNFWAPKEKSIT